MGETLTVTLTALTMVCHIADSDIVACVGLCWCTDIRINSECFANFTYQINCESPCLWHYQDAMILIARGRLDYDIDRFMICQSPSIVVGIET